MAAYLLNLATELPYKGLEAALDSRHEGYVRKETPWLDVTYDSYHDLPWRPTGPRPSGAALDPWPPGGYGEPVGKP